MTVKEDLALLRTIEEMEAAKDGEYLEGHATPQAYVAGPMRGYTRCNFDAFDQAAALARTLHWEVISPAEHDREGGFPADLMETCSDAELATSGFDLKAAMRWDLGVLLDPKTTDIILLPGWETSTGARLEYAVAEAVGLRVWVFHPAVGEGLGTLAPFGHPDLRVAG